MVPFSILLIEAEVVTIACGVAVVAAVDVAVGVSVGEMVAGVGVVLLSATMQQMVAVFPLKVLAVMVVLPEVFAVTTPLAETVATEVFFDLYVT